ncbi:MAG: hypothetical protein AB1700_14295 [Bacillota bacterium]
MDYVGRVFDYEALARQYDVQPETLAQLVEDARKEFPNDEMMIELHVIRALRWLKRQDPN